MLEMLIIFSLTPTELKLNLYTHIQAETCLEIARHGVLRDVKDYLFIMTSEMWIQIMMSGYLYEWFFSELPITANSAKYT